MAGHGPAPKAKEQRRTRHEPQRGEWVDLPPLEKIVLPELPERVDGEEWSSRSRGAWLAWQSDPVTQMWSPSDVAYALDCIMLFDAMTSSSANEVRLRMDGLGLTPKGKRDLRWRISEVAQDGAKRRAPLSASSRRGRLSVVQ